MDPGLSDAVPGTDAYAELIDRLIEDGSPATRHGTYRQQYGPGGVPLRRQVSLEEDSGSTTSSDGTETARLRQKFEEELRTVAALQRQEQDVTDGGDAGAPEVTMPPPSAPVRELAPAHRVMSPTRVRSLPLAASTPTTRPGYQTVKVTALVEKPSAPPKTQTAVQSSQRPVMQAKPSASTPSPPKQLTSSPDKDAIKPKPISPVVRRTVMSPPPPAGGRAQQAVPKLRMSSMQQQQLQPQQQQQQQPPQQQQQQQQPQQQQQQKTKSSGLRRFLSPAANLFASATGNSPRNRRSLSEDRSSRSSPLLLKPYKSKKQQPDAQEDARQRQPLLAQKKTTPQSNASAHDVKRKVYPTSNAPLVETAFLSEPKKPAQTATQQNLLNAGADYRNKPLPPVPPHRTSSRSTGTSASTGTAPTPPSAVVPTPVTAGSSSHSTARTIPDTSLVLEERLDSIRRSLTPTHYSRSEAPTAGDFVGRRHQKRYQSLPPMSSLPATRQQLEAMERAARGSPPASAYQAVGKPSSAVNQTVYQQAPANTSAGVYQNVQQTNRARQQASYPEVYYHNPHSRQHDTQSDTEALRQSQLPPQRGRGESIASDGADTVQSSRSIDASSPSSSSTATVVSSPQQLQWQQQQQQQQQQKQQQQKKSKDTVDSADLSPGGIEVQRVLQGRPPVAVAPSGRMSAPPSTADWQRRYGRIQQPPPPAALLPVSATIKVTREPVYGNLSQASPTQQPQRQQHVAMLPVSPPPDGTVRLSRRELEALYWQTQMLREELAAQKRYLGMTGPSPSSNTSVASTATAGSVSGVYASVLPRPQALYASSQPPPLQPHHRRSRSMSPSPYQSPVSPGSAYPLYGSNRSLSLSLPRGAVLPELYDTQQQQQPFVRGVPYRNTVAGIRSHSVAERTSTPTIYEEAVHQQVAALQRNQSSDATPRRRSQGHRQPSTAGEAAGSGPPPIFKRGSLQRVAEPEIPASSVPKRVSFTSGEDVSPSVGVGSHQNWPTRNGPAAQPPTRNRDSIDSDVFLPTSPPPASAADYVNLLDLGYGYGYGYGTSMAAERRRPYGVVVRRSAPAGSLASPVSPAGVTPERPLPPLPPSSSGELSGSNSSVYGVVVRKPMPQQPVQLSPDRWQYRAAYPSPTGRWQQSESESGSEAGEIQRILSRGRSSGSRPGLVPLHGN